MEPIEGSDGIPRRVSNAVPPGIPTTNAYLAEPAPLTRVGDQRRMVVELQEDGSIYSGWSFGFEKSIAGELVFQTGMVGYNESITDPSYRGQILVMTWPLVGNYGVPSREDMDALLEEIPAHFESAEIHIAGLIVASYAGEDYSHHLATSSLGTWLKEQRVPALYGVDTRAMTKKIRQQGSMLGRLLIESRCPDGLVSANRSVANYPLCDRTSWRNDFEMAEWADPNINNLVADGEYNLHLAQMVN